ncbi:hypothetical protein HCN44_001855 [Aphidius gifuensis]|uniref:non-specific serine/threonine protein kinase n=1 Tax=Aphidius gifuensis TaxID=684658 RepID=A0A834XZ21_APHGI|nr:serine-protein kinase ATM [Aphidius gifuensis]KAF7996223.1 hypothetical protein HCN44_001855 [Aphidius gifuensis]
MTNHSQHILFCLNKAKSTKITEKKEGVQELRGIFDNKSVVDEITKNSENRNDITWNKMLSYCHTILIDDICQPASRSKKIAMELHGELSWFISETVKLASTQKIVYLKIEDLMTFIIQVLSDDIYDLCYPLYMDILVNTVLANRLYRNNLSLEHWQELIKIYKNLYIKKDLTDKPMILSVLRKIIQYGCRQTNLVAHVNNILPFLKIVFNEAERYPKILEDNAYELAVVVFQEISTECRQSLCKFSETFPTSLITSSNNSKSKTKLLLYFVILHHPNGAQVDDKFFYTDDIDNWKKIIFTIRNFILKEKKNSLLSSSFISLGVEIFKQILSEQLINNDSQIDNDIDMSQKAKRRRVSLNFQTPIDLLNYEYDIKYRLPIVQILTSMFVKYPHVLKDNYLPNLLKIIYEMFIESIKNEDMINSLCQLSSIIINIENKYFNKSINYTVNCQYWNKIWDVLLKILGMNQNEIEAHKLLQYLIEFKGVQNLNAFVNLYFTNSIRWLPSSIRTLLILVENFTITENIETSNHSDESDKKRILKWILHGSNKEIIDKQTINNICDIVIGLIHKIYTKKSDKNDDKLYEKHHEFSHLNDNEIKSVCVIEKCALSQCFSSNLFIKNTNTVNDEDKKSLSTLTDENLDYVIDILHKLIDFKNNPIDDKVLAIYKLTIFAKFTSNLIELNIESANDKIEKLINSFDVAFNNFWQLILNENSFDGSNSNIINILKSLIILYDNNYHELIGDKLLSSLPGEILRILFSMLTAGLQIADESSEFQYIGMKFYDNIYELHACCSSKDKKSRIYPKEISENTIITIQIHQLLIKICTFETSNIITTRQIKILNNLLIIGVYKPNKFGNLWNALGLLKEIMKCKNTFLPENIYTEIEIFINELFKQWKDDVFAIEGILKILPTFIDKINKNTAKNNDDNFLNIFNEIDNIITRNDLGTKTQITFIKTIYKTMKIYSSSTLKYIVLNLMKNYLTSQLNIVRIETLPLLHYLFSSDTITIDEKTNLFNKILDILDVIFEVDENIDDDRIKDEKISRTSCAFLMLGCIINASGVFQSRALNTLMTLNQLKIKNKKMLVNIISSVFNNKEEQLNLVENNLYHILESWIEKELNFKEFPWYLTRCQNENEFFLKYAGLIVLIQLEDLNFESIRILCDNLSINFEKVIEDNFHLILNWLLATMSLKSNKQKMKYAEELFIQLKNNTNDFLNVKIFGDLLDDVFDKILIDLFQRLHDEKHFENIYSINISFPQMIVPNYKIDIIERSIHYLTKITTEKKSLIEYLVIERPNIIQQVFLTLVKNIYNQKMIEYKLKSFHHYSYFCQFLIDEISNDYFNNIAVFTLREIIYTLIHLIQDNIKPISELSGKLLLTILQLSLPSRYNEISDFLNFIVSSLIPIARQNNIKGIIKILNYLIVQSKDLLTDAIRKLDAFPNELIFDDINNTWNELKDIEGKNQNLSDKIQHFLNVFHENNVNCSLEGILHLKNELLNRRDELKIMYNDLDNIRGFAEDCISSKIHRLIYHLIKLTESSDLNISLEAAQCLGILGPVDLTTMILHSEEGHVQENFDTLISLTLKIIKILSHYLVDNCQEYREKSAIVLYDIYHSFWGNELCQMHPKNFSKYGDVKEIKLLLSYTHPFIPLKIDRKKSKKPTILVDKFKIVFNENNEYWKGENDESYSTWIKNLTCQILNCFKDLFSNSLIDFCKLSHEICETIIPRIIFIIIELNNNLTIDICTSLNIFFEEFYNSTCTAEQTMLLSTCQLTKNNNFSHESVKCMLNIVNYLRIQSGNNYQSLLNYLHISKAAQYCSAYFTSVLYAELSSEILKNQIKYIPDDDDSKSIIDYLCEKKPKEGKLLQDILREAFIKIGDPDSIHGCGSSYLKEQSSRIQHYIHFKEWEKVLITQDVDLSCGQTYSRGMANTLQNLGLDYLLNKFISTVKKDNDNIDDYIYNTAWRLSDWSIFKQNEYNNKSIKNNDYDYYHYQSLKCLNDKDLFGLDDAVTNARISVINSLKNTSLECSQTVYPILLKLKMLQEIQEFGKSSVDEWKTIVNDFRLQDLGNINDFTYIEPILTQRIVMYNIKNKLDISNDIKDAFFNTHLELSIIGEKQGYLHIAARTLELLGRQENLSSEIKDKLNYQEALLSWRRGDQNIAKYLMKNLICNESINIRLKAQCLKIYGDWVAETKSETHEEIINKYYKKSMDIIKNMEIKNSNDWDNLYDTYASLAIFSDTHYQQISEFMKTPMFKSLQKTALFARDESDNPQVNNKIKDKDIRRALCTNQIQKTNDIAEFEKIQQEQLMYLQLSIEYYLITLVKCEKHNHLIFRLISLWIKNHENEDLNNLIDQYIDNISTHKFISLLPQLSPHISLESNNFTIKINSLLKRCALEHPHHVLPVLLCLGNRDKDKLYQDPSIAKKSQVPDKCVRGALTLVNDLKKTNINLMINEYNEIMNALIELAYYQFDPKKSQTRIPLKFKIHKIRSYENSMVPTMTLDVNPNGNYNNIICVDKYIDTFESLGGINAPKKIICIGSDGVRRYQVVKVDSDIKTDAVMQQAFNVINTLFKKSKNTNKRKLHIRTYKVMLLSQKSGILQWCDNTLPLSSILVGDKNNIGLHKKYNPKDWDASECRQKIGDARNEPNSVKLEVYKNCCKNFKPAFQYFFLEKFPSPETWFERRLAYVRSIATTSMVGYILGIGDRHVSNILIDENTAEIVHIDFGIAFEQGKALPIPEPVPFRLTRDIEAAMGVSGVEGVLRRTCEETMTVLRDRREMINTLLQVLLYDPLFTWTVSPQKANQMQGGGGGQRRDVVADISDEDTKKENDLAKKSLLRMEQKLLGTEEGIATSISGQVDRLIQQARNPANLAVIFSGWQAHL